MSNVQRIAIVDPSDSSRDSLKSTLLGLDKVWLEAECSRYEFFADVVAQTHPDIGIVALDSDQEKSLKLLEQVTANSPECSILVVSSSSDGALILRAMRAGAKEYLTKPLKLEDLINALERIGDRRGGKGDAKRTGCVVTAVAGATGGVGTTSLAVNLGCILASDQRNSVVLVDLDLCLGDADVFLDTIPDYTLADVSQNVARLDFALLKRSLTKHSSGLYLLPRPVQLEDSRHIGLDDMQRVFGLLKATFTHMILDLSKSYSEIDMLAMETANHVLLVTQMDLPCLRNVVRLMMSFNEDPKLKDKLRVVVNRAGLDNGQISLKKAQETIGREIFWQIPNDYRTMVEVRNNGVPLIEHAPRTALSQSIVKLSEQLGGEPKPATDAAKPTSTLGKWLPMFAGKKGG
ncbi:MAG: response regulator [Pirellulales bacterium]|nr:response regulator [Pirellulales bacterium]